MTFNGSDFDPKPSAAAQGAGPRRGSYAQAVAAGGPPAKGSGASRARVASLKSTINVDTNGGNDERLEPNSAEPFSATSTHSNANVNNHGQSGGHTRSRSRSKSRSKSRSNSRPTSPTQQQQPQQQSHSRAGSPPHQSDGAYGRGSRGGDRDQNLEDGEINYHSVGSHHQQQQQQQQQQHRPVSPPSALGMTSWGRAPTNGNNNNNNHHNGNISARRGSLGVVWSDQYQGSPIDRNAMGQQHASGFNNSNPHLRRSSQPYGMSPPGMSNRHPGPGSPMSSHAAELMNMAAKKMSLKDDERAYQSHMQQRQQHHQQQIDSNLESEAYDQFNLPRLRSRSKSINYDSVNKYQPPPGEDNSVIASIWGRVQQPQHQQIAGRNQQHFGMGASSSGGMSVGSSSAANSPTGVMMPHRRSSTFSYASPAWDSGAHNGSSSAGHQGMMHQHSMMSQQHSMSGSPTHSSHDYDQMGAMPRRGPMDHMSPRRHSVAGSMAYHAPGRYLSEALTGISIDDQDLGGAGSGYDHLLHDVNEYFDQGSIPQVSHRASICGPTGSAGMSGEFSEVGRGLPLHALPSSTCLYIVEFKAGRSDIFYFADQVTATALSKGDLVIVEADRGKDLGKVINNSITPHQIHMLQAQQSDALNELHHINREIHPKRVYRLARAQEVAMLVTKAQDEAKAMAVCQTKVRQKKLPMEVVDAEYQWDRRKLTFYFVADRRIDFRELVRELFKIYKTRIWMCAVNAITKAPYFPTTPIQSTMSSPPGTARLPGSAPGSPPTMALGVAPNTAMGMNYQHQQQQQQQHHSLAVGSHRRSPSPSHRMGGGSPGSPGRQLIA